MSLSAVSPSPTVSLSDGVEMPLIALGTWPMRGDEAARAVASALEIGYRHIDTAEAYENEEAVGQGLRASGVPRERVFVTTKFQRQWHSREGVRTACEGNLRRLGLEYIDLLLIHWPNPQQGRYVEAFEGLLALRETGKVRAVGVSNFKAHHLADLFARGLVPQVNQIQLDPYHRRPDLEALHRERGIVTEAWSPLGRAGAMLEDPAIAAIAERHGRTTGQVVLRWQLQHGFAAAPKSADPRRQRQNLDLSGFELDAAEMALLDGLDRPDQGMLDADVFGH
ncbi:oxidoreductase [Sphaerotilus natans subsp. natans DSM 6575]|uniref:Oxidoreductase n=1 Tax=Sphaerotilus natans subsp. natans DSM 6575 TaxID=1286631 RepID=A0A059KNS7_9BURK|nr:aldo/keto reductase [Sphaerotilus natans]KDB53066.1 oxidoreductase [Sphaerotilus natans subsp. natans DSM 6575]SIQ28229.1 2,5-diketo-D-gluconate reductase A [Sphaerotilus natans]